MYDRHLSQYRMPRHCGMCTLAFNDGDRVNSLRPNPHLFEAKCVFTIDLIYRLGSYDVLRNQDLYESICHDVSCPCPKYIEHAVIHQECMDLFLHHAYPQCSMYNLWLAAVWRHPWSHAQWLNLPYTIADHDCIDPMSWVGSNYDIPQLRDLPNELLSLIWENIGPSEMWRYGHAMQFIKFLSQPRSAEHYILHSSALSSVLSWRRGTLPMLGLYKQPVMDTYTRLTFDARGLLKIETSEKKAPFYAAHTEDLLYVVEKTKTLQGLNVQFQFGMARLEYSRNHEIRFWNTPNPPSLKECAVDLNDLPPRCRLRVIDLEQCNTMSFFVADDSTFAVHGHSPTSRLAMDSQTTFEQLDHQVQSTTECLQVVLDEDKVVGFGILVGRDDMPSSQYMMGPGRSFVLSMERQGIIILGTRPQEPHDIIWVSQNPEWLVFDSPQDCPVRLVGCHPRTPLQRQQVPDDDVYLGEFGDVMQQTDAVAMQETHPYAEIDMTGTHSLLNGRAVVPTVTYWDGLSNVVKCQMTKQGKITGVVTRTRANTEVILP